MYNKNIKMKAEFRKYNVFSGKCGKTQPEGWALLLAVDITDLKAEVLASLSLLEWCQFADDSNITYKESNLTVDKLICLISSVNRTLGKLLKKNSY